MSVFINNINTKGQSTSSGQWQAISGKNCIHSSIQFQLPLDVNNIIDFHVNHINHIILKEHQIIYSTIFTTITTTIGQDIPNKYLQYFTIDHIYYL